MSDTGRVTLSQDGIEIQAASGRVHSRTPIKDIQSITVRPSWPWHRLTIHTFAGSETSIAGLKWNEAILIRKTALIESALIRKAEAEAEQLRKEKAKYSSLAKDMGSFLMRLDAESHQFFAGEHYVRYKNKTSLQLHQTIARTTRECQGQIRKYLEPEAKAALGRLEHLESPKNFEEVRCRANREFVARNAPAAQDAALATLPNPLTDEQAEAIATDEDVTLVLAGAGTGKTSVIVGKIAHLVHNQDIPPDEILVLAFNRKAADEIKERLKGELSEAHVRTFNGFGHHVISEVEGAPPTIAEFVAKSKERDAIEDIIKEVLEDPQVPESTVDFIASNSSRYMSAFDFDNVKEYNAYVRHVELRTLSNDRVKSFEELEIANYLTKHSVKFCYERPYPELTQSSTYRQYQPDFYLPDYDIYIEHQALDENGNPPSGWEGYKEKVEWARQTHSKYGTKLIETYSWQQRKGILLSELGKRLKKEGVKLNRVPIVDLVMKLAEYLIMWLADLMAKFLNHVRTNGFTDDKLRDRANKQGMGWLNRGFLRIFEQVRRRYEQRLNEKGEIDFHDQISRAEHYIREGKWKSPYKYVLVDEFQDISAGRMRQLQALQREDTAYFLVGDDWQSINRFAGSDVELMRNCGDYLGHVQTRTLTDTFRFGKGILNPSREFILRNPEQSKRKLNSASNSVDRGITVIYADDPAAGLERAREDIQEFPPVNGHSFLALGRYQSSHKALQGKRNGEDFSTVHRAKGREADYVAVLDLKDVRRGFPSRIEDHPLLDLVLLPTPEGAFPHAEERRLFYVAMTRARIGTYLIADKDRPSIFVKELLEQNGDITEIGVPTEECPECDNGLLRKRNGQYGQFWGCTEYFSKTPCRYKRNVAVVGPPGTVYCIRCVAILPLNPEQPFCEHCFDSWDKWKNPLYPEKYCHACGSACATSMLNPLCDDCQ